MLRSELPFAADRPERRALAVLLGEPFLGFLAILAVALTLFPMLFPLRPQAVDAIDVAQWAIIGWFAFEFVVAFAAAENKAQFLTNPWRWLDLATVLIALASLLPSASAALRSSPILRLARIGRLVSLGVRASGLSTRRRIQSVAEPKARGPAQVTLMADAPNASPQPADLPDVVAWLQSPDEQWFHVSNPSAGELKEIATAAGLPAGFFETHLSGTNYPHWVTAGEHVGLFLWMPELAEHGGADRHGMLFLPMGRGLLSLSRRKVHTIERTGAQDGDDDLPFAARMMAHVLGRVVRGNERLTGRCEEQLRELEDVPVRESRPQFFERTFRLKKELSAAQADLWRLKGIAGELLSGRRLFPGGPHPKAETYQRFANDVEYLHETTVNIREEVLSVIDLHLNVVSFEMNRVMRVLAVVSVLGLIPAVVGGLFGMNLIDNPWPSLCCRSRSLCSSRWCSVSTSSS